LKHRKFLKSRSGWNAKRRKERKGGWERESEREKRERETGEGEREKARERKRERERETRDKKHTQKKLTHALRCFYSDKHSPQCLIRAKMPITPTTALL
jgi:hypothetical protein